MATIVLAVGFATHLYPITLDRPKPLLCVAGKPISDHILESEPLPGCTFVSINSRFLAQLKVWHRESRSDFKFAVEETMMYEKENLGTVGAVAFFVGQWGIDKGCQLEGIALREFLVGRGTVLVGTDGRSSSAARRSCALPQPERRA